ncbi:hypothetical protein EB093_05360 [bacterium]|nr:hypothetical protein [bacterium]
MRYWLLGWGLWVLISGSIIGETLPVRWSTKLGITNFKTTIHLFSQAIAVGSNGETRQGLNDPSDGVYWMDAKTGEVIRRQGVSGHEDLDINGVALGGKKMFAATHSGRVMAYEIYLNGELLWNKNVGAGVKSALAVEDVNSDGVPDVIVATVAGEVLALDGKNGDTIWSTRIDYKANMFGLSEKSFIASPALLDVNRDGTRDVILGSRNGSVYAFSGRDGAVIWEFRTLTPSGVHSSACVTSGSILVAESSGKVHWLDNSGALLRSVTVGAPDQMHGLFASPVAFPNGSVVIGSSWPSAKSGIWYIPTASTQSPVFFPAGKVSATAVVGDGLGTGEMQAWVVTEGGQLWVINSSGALMRVYDLPAGSETTPLMADIDGDGQLELLIAGSDKFLRAYQLPGRGPVGWQNFRGNLFNTGVANDRLEFYQPERHAIETLRVCKAQSPMEFIQKERVYRTAGYDSESTLISPEGFGFARLGVTWGRLKRAMGPGVECFEGRFGMGYRGISVVQDGEEQFVVLFPEWKRYPIDSDPVLMMMTYNRKFRTKEGVGPGTPISVAQAIYGTPNLTFDTKTKQESVSFKSMPWDKIRFGLIPVTGEYSSKGSVKTVSGYPEGSFINYVEIRLN